MQDNKGHTRRVSKGVYEIIDREKGKKGFFVTCRFYTLRKKEGKNLRIRKTFRIQNNDTKINQRFNRFLVDVYNGKYDEKKTHRSLFETLDNYLESYVKNNKSKMQYQKEKASIASLKAFLKKDRDVLSLQRKHALDFLSWYRHKRKVKHRSTLQAPLSNATLNKTKAIFSFFFRTYLFDRGIADGRYNPFERIWFKEEKKRKYVLKAGELDALMQSFSRQHERTFVSLCFYACLRSGEAKSLKWSDVDLEKREMHLREEATKTKQMRFIPILPQLLVELRKQWSEYGSMGMNEYVVYHDDLYGRKLSTFKKSWKKAKEQLPWLSDLTPHGLRHNGATWMSRNGVNHDVIRQILGHTSLEMTLRYLHTEDDFVKKELFEKMAG